MKSNLASIYGTAIGDTLGVPYEDEPRDTFVKMSIEDAARIISKNCWSDDTAMTLATSDSINLYTEALEDPIDHLDLEVRFEGCVKENHYMPKGMWTDYGSTTIKAICSYGMYSIMDHGNGSLMRISPLAYIDDITDAQIRAVSAITHAHEIPCQACVIYVRIAQKLLYGCSIREALSAADVSAPFDRLKNIAKLDREEINSTGYVVDTLEAALWCLSNTGNFADCVMEAVALGGDADTTAAVAGALAGIVYGIEGIPKEWIDALQNKELLDSCSIKESI